MQNAAGYPLHPEEMQRRLAVMREAYRAKAPEKIAEIEALWLEACSAGVSASGRDALVLAVHSMVGSAPTLGCEALGAAAKALEGALRAAFASETMAPAGATEIGRLIAVLRQSIA